MTFEMMTLLKTEPNDATSKILATEFARQNILWESIYPDEKLWGEGRYGHLKLLAISFGILSDRQARRNHAQSLQQLNKRGGVGLIEAEGLAKEADFCDTLGLAKDNLSVLRRLIEHADAFMQSCAPKPVVDPDFEAAKKLLVASIPEAEREKFTTELNALLAAYRLL